jgi:hypothetical protein
MTRGVRCRKNSRLCLINELGKLAELNPKACSAKSVVGRRGDPTSRSGGNVFPILNSRQLHLQRLNLVPLLRGVWPAGVVLRGNVRQLKC